MSLKKAHPVKGLRTRSELFKIGFEVRSNQSHPDIVEFFDMFGLKMFAGTLNIRRDLEKLADLEMMFDQFNKFLDSYDDSYEWDIKNVSRVIHNAYFTKIIYQDHLNGNTWHTPICAVYDHNKDTFILTKGAKKVLASELIGIKTLPAVILSRDRKMSGRKLKSIKSDLELHDFIKSMAVDQMQDPYVGVEYFDLDGLGKLPVIHWINISKESSERINYYTNFVRDLKYWRKFPDRIVTSDVMPDIPSRYHNHKLLSGLVPDSKVIRQHMPKDAVAHIYTSKDRTVCRLLSDALAWLGTTADSEPVGEAVSACGRYKIVFNNKSDIITEIPYGILNK